MNSVYKFFFLLFFLQDVSVVTLANPYYCGARWQNEREEAAVAWQPFLPHCLTA
jgi:hypothetical protein